MSVFQCHLLISKVIHQVHMNLFNLTNLQWVNLADVPLRPDMSIGEVSHDTPFITINKSHLNRLNINITTHLVQHCKLIKIRQECMGVCVCMCVTALLKAKMFKAFAIYFSVYLLG